MSDFSATMLQNGEIAVISCIVAEELQDFSATDFESSGPAEHHDTQQAGRNCDCTTEHDCYCEGEG